MQRMVARVSSLIFSSHSPLPHQPAKAKPEMIYGVTFFNRFRDMTASGFFSSAIGFQDLQYQGNVFNPGYDGCPPAALQKLGVSYDLMQTRVKPQEK